MLAMLRRPMYGSRRSPEHHRPCAPLAQLDRAPDYESGGQEFESLRARQSLPELSGQIGSGSIPKKLGSIVGLISLIDEPRCTRPSAGHVRTPRVRLELAGRQDEDDLGEGGRGVAYGRQPALLQTHMVATSISQISKRSWKWSAAPWPGTRYHPWVRCCRRLATIPAGVLASTHRPSGLKYRLRTTAGNVLATTDQRSPEVRARGSISSQLQRLNSR